MKVITRWTIPSERNIETTCHKCNSVLQFGVMEVKIEKQSVAFKCPVCDENTREDFKYVGEK